LKKNKKFDLKNKIKNYNNFEKKSGKKIKNKKLKN
jgi:hypothetical protein